MKTQPEFVVKHLRTLLNTQAVIQIHRRIKEGFIVDGWGFRGGNLVQKLDGTDPHENLLTVVDGVICVVPLGNVPLEGVDSRLIVNADEKPIAPDCPLLRNIGGRALGFWRSSTWTVTPWVTAEGKLIHLLIIMRGESVSRDVYRAINAHGFSVITSENGCTSDSIFLQDLKIALEKIGATEQNPGIMIFDGHASRLQRKVMNL